MTGFNEVNRFSYSGSDARAFAFYPSSFGDKTTPGVANELEHLYVLKNTAIQNVINRKTIYNSNKFQIIIIEHSIKNNLKFVVLL